MEKIRREMMQQNSSWGDMTPSYDTKSGSPRLPSTILDHCQATYTAAASCIGSPTMHEHPPHQTHVPTSTQGWSLDVLLSTSPNFKPVQRLSANAMTSQELERYDESGEPLIIENLHQHPCWPEKEFNLNWFKANGPRSINVRNVIDGSDKDMPISEFIDTCRTAAPVLSETDQERWYGKDVECPAQWRNSLEKIGIPDHLLPGSATDLLSNQPSQERVKTLMCYLGIGDTLTPCHKDPCGSSGQNLMCYTENGGSSYWFMTETKDIFLATQFFHAMRQELDHEKHVIPIEHLAEAPFNVYIAEQKLGDLVLVPSRSCHQVINCGGFTIKTSWSRMTLNGLVAAYYHELPVYQRVCREETYRVKFTVYCTIKNLTEKLEAAGQASTHPRPRRKPGATPKLRVALKHLLDVYDDILADERPHQDTLDKLEYADPLPERLFDSDKIQQDASECRITCDFCGADIFQSFLECAHCTGQSEYIAVCPRCYVDGRTCNCGEMKIMQYRPFDVLEKVRAAAATVLGTRTKRKSPELGSFGAACVNFMRGGLDETEKCSASSAAHEATKYNSFYYASHHKSYCFKHLLANFQMHAVDAFLAHGPIDKHADHGDGHSSDRVPDRDINKFAESVRQGKRPDFRFQRFHMATHFTKCAPPNQGLRSGYYDEGLGPYLKSSSSTNQGFREYQISQRPPSSPVDVRSHQRMSLSPVMSILTELPSDCEVEPAAPLLTKNKKRRRKLVFDGVEVPLLRDISKYKSPISVKTVDTRSGVKPGKETGEPHHSNHIIGDGASESVGDSQQVRIPTPDANSNIGSPAVIADQRKQDIYDRELPSPVDTSAEESVRGSEEYGEPNIIFDPLGEGTSQTITHLRHGMKSIGKDGRQPRSAPYYHRVKRDLRANILREDTVDPDINKTRLVTRKIPTEPQCSEDDSDTAVASRTSPDEQTISTRETSSSSPRIPEDVNYRRTPTAELNTIMEDDAMYTNKDKDKKSTKRPLDSRDTQTIGADSASLSKRRRFRTTVAQRGLRRKDNEVGGRPTCSRANSGPVDLVGALNAASVANQNTSPPTKPAMLRESGSPIYNRANGASSHPNGLVGSFRPVLAANRDASRPADSMQPQPHDPMGGGESPHLEYPTRESEQRNGLAEEEREGYEKRIVELDHRLALLEKKLERRDQDPPQVPPTVLVEMIPARMKEVVPTSAAQIPPWYYVPVALEQMKGSGLQRPVVPLGETIQIASNFLSLQNDAYRPKVNYRANQYYNCHYDHRPIAPRADMRNGRFHGQQRIQGSNTRHYGHTAWKNRPNVADRRYNNRRYQAHGEIGPYADRSEASRSPWWTSPIPGPSGINRQSRTTFGNTEAAGGSYYRGRSRTPSVPPPPLSPPDSVQRGQDDMEKAGESEGRQDGQGQSSDLRSWVFPDEEQGSQWEDDYVRDGASDTDNGWGERPNSSLPKVDPSKWAAPGASETQIFHEGGDDWTKNPWGS